MKNKSTEKIIEEISLPNTTSDLWDELYKGQSPQVILSFRDGTGYKLRLLGPFVHGNRVFLAPNFKFYEFMNASELTQILQGHEPTAEAVVQRILNKTPDSIRKKLHVSGTQDIKGHSAAGKKVVETVSVINNMCKKVGWQPVVFSNAVVLDTNATFPTSSPSIICLSKNLCYQILGGIVALSKDREDAALKRLSGLHAHDIMIARQGQGLNSKYTVRISKNPEHLPSPMISFILKEGLWDIKKVVQASNKKIITGKMSGFLHRVSKEYKMSSELMTEIFEQAQKIDDASYMDTVEEQISDLPQDAFERYASENSIGSLEL